MEKTHLLFVYFDTETKICIYTLTSAHHEKDGNTCG